MGGSHGDINHKLLTVQEVCRLFGVHESTVHSWLKAGYLLHIRTPGGTYRIFREHVELLLAPSDKRDDAND